MWRTSEQDNDATLLKRNALMEGAMERGGEGGIRTLGKVTPTHAFQACSFSLSDTSPQSSVVSVV
jgi:hypothetical protein